MNEQLNWTDTKTVGHFQVFLQLILKFFTKNIYRVFLKDGETEIYMIESNSLYNMWGN